MDEARQNRQIARMMGIQITVGAVRRMFPGVSQSALYAAAPHDGRGRHLSLDQAFEIARRQFEAEATEATAQQLAQDRETAAAEKRASAALPAMDHLARVIAAEMAALSASLRQRGASDRAICLIAAAEGRSVRHAARLRVRVARQIEKAGLADDLTP